MELTQRMPPKVGLLWSLLGLQGVLLGAQWLYARLSVLTSAAPRVRCNKLRVQQRHERAFQTPKGNSDPRPWLAGCKAYRTPRIVPT